MRQVLWLTGESGAGKTTVAEAMRDVNDVILDGNEMRDSVSLNPPTEEFPDGAPLGFSKEERRGHNLRVARLARELSKRQRVIVSVIAPISEVRKEIEKICNPIWIYVKRTLPKREHHFYEEPTDYFITDHDELDVEQSVNRIRGYLLRPKFSMLIGRYQVKEPHEGHKALIQSLLDEGKNVCIALRDTPVSPSDPYSMSDRMVMFETAYKEEIEQRRVMVISIPDIEEVCYGRKVGWGIREIRLPEDLENISGTKIREGYSEQDGGEKA